MSLHQSPAHRDGPTQQCPATSGHWWLLAQLPVVGTGELSCRAETRRRMPRPCQNRPELRSPTVTHRQRERPPTRKAEGSYIVASEEFGRLPGLMAAAGLLIDYVMTVAVSVASGVAAITSAYRRCSQRPCGSALA